MRALVLSALCGCLAGALCAGDGGSGLVFGKKRYQVRPLEFEVAVPEGWQAQHDHTGFVAHEPRRPQGMGFMISREPMLFRPDDFAQAWQARLVAAGIETQVSKTKSGRYVAWKAAWETEAGGGSDGGAGKARSIEVWRLYATDPEMVYNVSFTAPKGAVLEPLVDGVLGSFRCTAKPPELRFQRTAQSVGTRAEIFLPVGYEPLPRGVRLGGGGGGGFVRTLPGYGEKPHVAGRISIRTLPAGRPVQLPNGQVVMGSNTKELVDALWTVGSGGLGEPEKKPRLRSASISGMKGHSLEVLARDKETGLPKQAFVFAGKLKQNVFAFTIVVDEREVRLHKGLFKRICGKLHLRA